MKVLITDDEKQVVDDLVKVVKTLWPKACADGAVSAAEALELAEKTEYDVALLDIVMPGMDGLTLARQLMASFPAINIIFVTEHAEYALQAHEIYCSAFLVKPVGEEELQQAFAHLRWPVIDLLPEQTDDYYAYGAVIGKKIELYRKQRGLSRQELADRMEVSRQTVFRWEHGDRVPDILTFLKLVRILGSRIEDVIGECE